MGFGRWREKIERNAQKRQILLSAAYQWLGKIHVFALDQFLVQAPLDLQLESATTKAIFSMNETPTGPAGSTHRAGSSGRDSGEQSALQTRAAFLKNWSWELVTGLNRAACARGSAQHGINPEAGSACQNRWEEFRVNPASLLDTLEFLRSLHRSAPYLFFNGNTFADIGRRICDTLFADLSAVRRRELASCVAHYIAGVLDRESMISSVDSLWASATLTPGDRVQTLRGSTCGAITRVLEDGRVAWRPDGSTLELIALPESLVALSKP